MFGDVKNAELYDEEITIELSISTLGRILKITNLNPTINIICEAGLPVRFRSVIGSNHSTVDVFVEQEGTK